MQQMMLAGLGSNRNSRKIQKSGLGFIDPSVFRLVENISLETGISLIGTDFSVHGTKINTTGKRLMLIRHSGHDSCYMCNKKVTHFNIECQRGELQVETSSLVLNPYTVDSNGNQILMTWDHIYPRCLGGSDTPENSALCCQECNNEKGQKVDEAVIAHVLKYPAALTPTRVQKAIIQGKAKIKFFRQLYELGCFNHVPGIKELIYA